MRLHEWFEVSKKTQKEAAEEFGLSQAFLSQLLRGERVASDDVAARIEAVTEGQVTFLELKHPKYRAAASE